MKKLILPLILFVLALFFLPNTFAQNPTDCWSKHMIKQYSVCAPPHTACLQKCSVLDTTPERKVCFEECGRINKLCTDKAVADYKACVAAQTGQVSETSTLIPSPSPSDEESPEIPPVEQVEQPAKSSKDINDWINDTFGEVDFERIVTTGPELDRLPLIGTQPEPVVEKPTPDNPFSAGIWRKEGGNRASIQYPGSNEFTEMKPGKIPIGSIIRSGNDQIYIYNDEIGKSILEPGSEMVLTEIGPLPKKWADFFEGTIEVQTEKTSQSSPEPGISTEFVDIYVIGTHYWITHQPGKQTLVGVYEGQVEIKTKDGKTQIVSPNGDKPGVVAVSQKLSPVKLAITGLILVAIIGGAAFLLKRKLVSKGISKKKK